MIDLYSLPILAAAILNLGLALLILAVSKRKSLHWVFAAWYLCLAFWNLGVFMLHDVPGLELAWFWTRLLQNFLVFIYSTYFHMVVLLTHQESKKLNRLLIYLGYCSSVVFLMLNNSGTLFVKDVVRYSWGYYPLAGIGGAFYSIVFFAYVIYSTILLSASYRSSIGNKRRQLGLLLIAVLIGYGTSIINFLPSFGVDIYPAGNAFNIFFSLLTAYAILRFKFLIVNSLPEDDKAGANPYVLEPGLAYLVKQSPSENLACEIFVAFVRTGTPGLIITPRPPGQVREHCKLSVTPIIHLTEKEEDAKEELTVSPRELPVILSTLQLFAEQHPDNIVLLDGLDLLIQTNRREVVEFMSSFNKLTARYKLRLLIPVKRDEIDAGSEETIQPSPHPLLDIFGLKALLFEQFCNNILAACSESAASHGIRSLKIKDPFFNRLDLQKKSVTVTLAGNVKIKRSEFADKLQVFASAFSGLAVLISTAKKYGLPDSEFLIAKGQSGLVTGEVGKGFALLRDFQSAGYPTLCFSQKPPTILKEAHGLSKTKIYWLNQYQSADCINPANLAGILEAVKEFIAKNQEAVILLEGVELLAAGNGFAPVLDLLSRIKSAVSNNQARFILEFLPFLFNQKEIDKISKGMEKL